MCKGFLASPDIISLLILKSFHIVKSIFVVPFLPTSVWNALSLESNVRGTMIDEEKRYRAYKPKPTSTGCIFSSFGSCNPLKLNYANIYKSTPKQHYITVSLR